MCCALAVVASVVGVENDDARGLEGDRGEVDGVAARPSLSTMPELVTVAQAARCLGLGRSTLYRLLADGEVPVKQFLIGREVRLAKRQLIAWLEGRLEPTPATSVYDELEQVLTRRAS